MNNNQSVVTISAPEFINLSQDAINPGISKCEIKVLYIGKNRNGSDIDKETAVKMAETLPGCPIVGAYLKDREDFGDHGDVITIEDGEVHFSCKTVPYGFVSPEAKVWFQKFTDTDKYGNEVIREYMMTTGYLWTKQYEEAQSIMEDGKGQSMELDGDSIDGHWATDNNSGMEFFIINDAAFTKLCILGDDVEPCFEGASIGSPEVSKEFFTMDKSFERTLFTMMNELKEALQSEGGLIMPKPSTEAEETEVVTEFAEEAVEEVAEEAPEQVDESSAGEEFTAKEEDDEEEAPVEGEEEDKKVPAKHSLEEVDSLLEKFNSLQEKYNALLAEAEGLRSFKLKTEEAEKDALIDKYHMLSDEDKAEVIDNKDKYSLDEIESKLALIYVKKNVDFESVDGVKEEAQEPLPVATFSLDDNYSDAGIADPFIEALREANELLN